jgi:phage baseplate assembly protein W
MADVSHTMGSDLQLDATGDIATSDGSQLGQERVLRRLLTNPGAYIWQPQYGAGLARFLGRPMAAARISAISRAQMYQEDVVSHSPAPTIKVVPQDNGTFTETIRYVDAQTGQSVPLTFSVGE